MSAGARCSCGGELTAPDRRALAEVLAVLHSCPPSSAPVGRHRPAVDDAESIAAAPDELRDGGGNRIDLLDVG